MTPIRASEILCAVLAEVLRHQHAIESILDDGGRPETPAEEEQRAAKEDAGAAHGHPGAPRPHTHQA